MTNTVSATDTKYPTDPYNLKNYQTRNITDIPCQEQELPCLSASFGVNQKR